MDKKTVKKTKPSEGTADSVSKPTEPAQKKNQVANLDNNAGGMASWDTLFSKPEVA